MTGPTCPICGKPMLRVPPGPGDCPSTISVVETCWLDAVKANAALAGAKREALEAAAESFSTGGDDRKHIDCDAVAAYLRRMAREPRKEDQ